MCFTVFAGIPNTLLEPVAYPGIIFGMGFNKQLRTEGRENENLGAVAP
jgi:hypothetical protein